MDRESPISLEATYAAIGSRASLIIPDDRLRVAVDADDRMPVLTLRQDPWRLARPDATFPPRGAA
jgi:hypothetical protein